MALTTEDIEKIATLARLNLTTKEKFLYAKQLTTVLDYIEMLNEVNTDDILETCQVTGLEDVTREDKAVETTEENRKKLVELFPDRMGALLKVKAVFDN